MDAAETRPMLLPDGLAWARLGRLPVVNARVPNVTGHLRAWQRGGEAFDWCRIKAIVDCGRAARRHKPHF